MSEADLERKLYPEDSGVSKPGAKTPPDFAHIHQELQRHKHTTLQLLWEEYRAGHANGYGYSRFCHHYQRWRQERDLVLRQQHRPGEKLFVDWAGATMPLYDPATGQARPTQLFVAVLGASNYIRLRDEAKQKEVLNRAGYSPCDRPPVDPTYFQTFELYEARKKAIPDPTTLILVDEADRLQMNSLEQMRSIFDEGSAGMVLIGMPGIEKRIARFSQFYSRIWFVHEFRPLDATEMQELLEQRWTPVGVMLPDEPFAPEVMARLIRMTGGNFRLLTRLLTQIERVLEVNQLHIVSAEVVEAARDSLVIGQS
jgi:hypothetical protein